MRFFSILSVLTAVFLLTGCGGDAPPPPPEPAAEAPQAVPTDRTDLQKDFLDDVPGRWTRVRPVPEPELTAEQKQRIRRLESLGYASGSRAAKAVMGVTRHDPQAAAGLNFMTSGHGPEATLFAMDGAVLHTWRRPFRDAFPDLEIPADAKGAEHWRRARPLPDGSLLVILEGLGLMKLDRDSRVLWAVSNGAHHDLEVLPDGVILVLTREGRVIPEIHPTEPVLEDFVVRLDADGRELSRTSLLEAFLRAPRFRSLWERRRARTGDVFHTNSVELLDGRIADRAPEFAAGRVLVSILKLDLVAVVDLESGLVVWAQQGDFHQQHDATIRPDGMLMLFDNIHRPGVSDVHVIDPADGSTVERVGGSPADPLFSRTCGTAQPLPGGGLLITESDNGRALELAADGAKVWEFHNPHRAGPDDAYVATLFEVLRLPEDFFGVPFE